MPRSRAYRRHKRAVKLARRYRIMLSGHGQSWYRDHPLTPRAMHAHLACNCFDEPRASALDRRRSERQWRQEWEAGRRERFA